MLLLCSCTCIHRLLFMQVLYVYTYTSTRTCINRVTQQYEYDNAPSWITTWCGYSCYDTYEYIWYLYYRKEELRYYCCTLYVVRYASYHRGAGMTAVVSRLYDMISSYRVVAYTTNFVQQLLLLLLYHTIQAQDSDVQLSCSSACTAVWWWVQQKLGGKQGEYTAYTAVGEGRRQQTDHAHYCML